MPVKSSAQGFKSKFITADLAHLFSQSDSEGEEFEGFSEEEDEERGRFSQRLKTMRVQLVQLEEDSEGDTGFYSDGEEPPPKRRSLCVALRFPTKRLSAPKQNVPERKGKKTTPPPPPPSSRRTSQRMKHKTKKMEEEEEETTVKKKRKMTKETIMKQRSKMMKEMTLKQMSKTTKEMTMKQRSKMTKETTTKKKPKKEEEVVKEEEEEEVEEDEALSQSLHKRDKNIKENKAMLAKLFADLSTMADLTPLNTPQKKKRAPATTSPRKRKSEPEAGSERRNPSRAARPPEHFGMEEKREPSEPRTPRTIDIRRLVEVDGELVEESSKKRRRKSQFDPRSVDEITEDDLDNIAYRAKDKIWDKDTGTSCHQCRQKTLDTKTVCRSGFCVGVKGQFCGPCLKNRYGEDVRKVLLDPTWSCPICRGMCNCSLCRKREGRCATGILVGLARYNGHNNVHQYLESIQKELEEI